MAETQDEEILRANADLLDVYNRALAAGKVESDDPSAQAGLDWDRVVAVLGQVAEECGEPAGYPVPTQDFALVVEPSHPYYRGLSGMTATDRSDEEIEAEKKANLDKLVKALGVDLDQVEEVNHWWSWRKNATIHLWYDKQNKRRWHTFSDFNTAPHRMLFHLNTTAASRVWRLDTEVRAMSRLSTILRPYAYRMYLLTHSFLEQSVRSGVFYYFRRSLPTVALGKEHDGTMKILCTLCLHPLGHYQDTFAGCMCPTDDVIAHLTMMRADEHLFWRKANQHPIWDIRSGL